MKAIQFKNFIKIKFFSFLKLLILLIPLIFLVPLVPPILTSITNFPQIMVHKEIDDGAQNKVQENNQDIEKIQEVIPVVIVRNTYISVVQIVFLIAVLEFFAVIIIRLIEEGITTKVRILPFENNTSSEDFNGKAISDSLIAELHRIYFFNFSKEKYSKSLSQKTSIVASPQISNFALPLHFHETMQENIVDI